MFAGVIVEVSVELVVCERRTAGSRRHDIVLAVARQTLVLVLIKVRVATASAASAVDRLDSMHS